MDEKIEPKKDVCKKCTSQLIIGIVIGIVVSTVACLVYFLVIADTSQDGLGLSIGRTQLPIASNEQTGTPVREAPASNNDLVLVTTNVPSNTIVNLEYAKELAHRPIVDVHHFPEDGVYGVASEGRIFLIPDTLKKPRQTDVQYANYFMGLVADQIDGIQASNGGPLIVVEDIYGQGIFIEPEIQQGFTADMMNDVIVDIFQNGFTISPDGLNMNEIINIAVVEGVVMDYLNGAIATIFPSKKPTSGFKQDESDEGTSGSYTFNWKTGKWEKDDDEEDDICGGCPSRQELWQDFEGYWDNSQTMQDIVNNIVQDTGMATYSYEDIVGEEAFGQVFITNTYVNRQNMAAANVLNDIFTGLQNNMTMTDFQGYWNTNQNSLMQQYGIDAKTANQITVMVDGMAGDVQFRSVMTNNVFRP